MNIQPVTDLLALLDRSGRYLWVGPGAVQLLGYAEDELVGRPIQDFLHPRDRAAVSRALDDPPARVRLGFQHRQAHGQWRDLEAWLYAVHLDSQPLVLLAGWCATTRQELDRVLLNHQRIVNLSRLAGGLVHDLNNLLSVASGLAELMTSEEPASVQQLLPDLQLTISQATGLTRQMVATSRTSHGGPQQIELNSVITAAARLLQTVLGPEIKLELALSASLWRVRIYPEQIMQVLLNLLSNARDAMPWGGTVTIRTANTTASQMAAAPLNPIAPHYVLLAIQDEGVGMSAETRQRLFEPFFSTKGAGLGLGMSICSQIAQLAGGHIKVDSQPGAGTTVMLYLPRGLD